MTNSASSEVTHPYAVEDETAAVLLGLSPSTLEKDRATGHLGIPFVRAGRRVIYRLEDLQTWLNEHKVTPTEAETGGGHV